MKLPGRIAIGAVAGAIVGGLLGSFGVLLVLSLLYDNLEQGGLVEITTTPIGALIGLVLGAVIVLAWSLRPNDS